MWTCAVQFRDVKQSSCAELTPPPFPFLETGFLCVVLAVPELTLKTRMVLNSEIHLPTLSIVKLESETGHFQCGLATGKDDSV